MKNLPDKPHVTDGPALRHELGNQSGKSKPWAKGAKASDTVHRRKGDAANMFKFAHPWQT